MARCRGTVARPGGATAHDRQIRNQRGELRTELTDDLVGQRGLRHLPAHGTPTAVTAIFGDVRFNRRQFRDLMASWVARFITRVQRSFAVVTRVGNRVNGRVHTLGGDQRPRVSGMAGLPAGFRRLLRRRPRTRCRPASPSDAGGFDVIVEFWLRSASGSSCVMSLTLAAVTCATRGTPRASVMR